MQRMRHFALWLGYVALMAASSATVAQDRAPAHRQTMAELAAALEEVLPRVADPVRFETERAAPQLTAAVERLARAAGRLQSATPVPDDDPAASYVARRFDQRMARAERLLKRGPYETARQLLATAGDHCIACHSRTPHGQEMYGALFATSGEALPPLDRADLLFAARRYDAALAQYRLALMDKALAARYPHRLERAAVRAIAIAARARRDPALTRRLALEIAGLTAAPLAVRRQAQGWSEAAASWLKETPTELATVADATQFARGLLAAADAQDRAAKGAGIVDVMRASTMLHEVLRAKTDTPPAERAEALELTGLAAERLMPVGFPGLPEAYFDACVRTLPDSQVGKRCYERFAASQQPDESDAKGRAIFSPDVQRAIEELRHLSGNRF